jgi:RNA polymerase sigma-70 factor (ECF subfamily)
MTGDVPMATETTQDTFVQAWRGLKTFRIEASFSTWLYRLAFNAVRQKQRSAARRAAWSVPDENLEPTAEIGRSGVEDIRVDLDRAIARLPVRARTALILHDIHGYKCHEVADLTGTAVGTIQAHLHRARKLLREILGP